MEGVVMSSHWASTTDEFSCPVSGRLMEDPVVVPAGHSLERSCMEACNELGYFPPLLLSSPSSPADPIDPPPLRPTFPNHALKGVIRRWCAVNGRPSPTPLSQEEARSVVDGLKNGRAVPPEVSIFQDLRNANDIAAQAACRAMLELSLTQADRIKIAGHGAVPPLLHFLANGKIMGSRMDAARALRNLAEDERLRTFMGALGAIPPLLDSFSDLSLSLIARRESASALNYLTRCPRNLAILANTTDAVPLLLLAATDETGITPIGLRIQAMRLLKILARRAQSVDDLINWGAVGSTLKMVGEERGILDRHCLVFLNLMCVGSPSRFSEMAADAGADEVLEADKEGWGNNCREMAKTMLKAVREYAAGGQPPAPEQ